MNMETIKSLDNSKVKLIKSLNYKKYRLEKRLYLLEGINIIKDAPPSILHSIYVREDNLEKFKSIVDEHCVEWHLISNDVFDKVSNTVNSNGLMAIAQMNKSQQELGDKIVVLDQIRDPGNLGTIFRTGVALGYMDYLLINCTDAFSPKVVRASMGAIFTANIIESNTFDVQNLAKKYEFYALDMLGENIYDAKVEKKFALVVGSEAGGISSDLLALSKKKIGIPIDLDKVESLNAAIAFAIAASVFNFKTS